MSKRALILIDIQNDYFEGGKWTLEGMDSATANAARVLSAARETVDELSIFSIEDNELVKVKTARGLFTRARTRL